MSVPHPTTATAGGALDAVVTRALHAESRKRRRAAITRRVLSIVSPMLILLLWEILVRVRILDQRFFSRPTDVFVTLVTLIGNGSLAQHVAVSMSRVVVGFATGAAAGLIAGTMMGLSPWVRAALNPVVAALYPIPKIAILPLLMIIFGLGDTSKIIIIAIGVFFPVLINTLLGVITIPPIFLEVADNFGATGARFYRHIVAPAALPAVFSGLKLGAGMSLLVLIAAEFVGSADGLGAFIWSSWQTYQLDKMYAGLVTIAFLGYVIVMGLDELERIVLPWRER